ncbi:MAG: hypothetical protein IBX62_03325 [Coriobacteriia bacterium]|nr:hypothetical protein [Coriobacteriia bacterium]
MTRESQGFDTRYNETDMSVVYEYGPWSDWSEMIGWLLAEGESDPRFGPGKVTHIVADLQQLEKDRVPFTGDPDEAYRMALSHRRPL